MYTCVQASFSIGPTAPTYFQQSETDVGPTLEKVVSVEQQSRAADTQKLINEQLF